MSEIVAFLTHIHFLTLIGSFFTASFAKGLLKSINARKNRLLEGFDNGGMPSSHTASVIGVATSLYLATGLSDVFFLSVLVAIVVTNDAVKVRRSVGLQALALNVVLGSMKEKEVPVVYGHTVMQVLVGAMIGIAVALFLHTFM